MADPIIEHDRPAEDAPSTETPETDVSQLSEYEVHKAARGYGKPPGLPKVDTPPKDAAAPDEGEEDAPEPADPEPPEPETKVDAGHRFEDPDTGEVLDLRRRASKRVKTLLTDRARLRAENEDLRRQLSSTPRPADEGRPDPRQTAPSAPSAASDDPEPSLEDFQSYNDFTKATARWVARQEFKTARESERASGEQARQREQFSQQVETYTKALPAVRQALPDYDEVVSRVPMIPATQHITRAILSSAVGPQLAYFLGSNPDALRAIVEAPTLDAHLRLIGRYEAQVEAAQTPTSSAPTRTPRAPEPVAPVHTATPQAGKVDPTSNLQAWRKSRGMPERVAR